MKWLLVIGLLASPAAWDGGPYAHAPHCYDEVLLDERARQLHRLGAPLVVVYQCRRAAAGTADSSDAAPVVSYLFWQTGTRQYAQKITATRQYEPVPVAGRLFSYPGLAGAAVVTPEREQWKFTPPFVEPSSRGGDVVVLLSPGRRRYFECGDVTTYAPDPARQRQRELWRPRLRRDVALAESLFGRFTPYDRHAADR